MKQPTAEILIEKMYSELVNEAIKSLIYSTWKNYFAFYVGIYLIVD